jgi:hypothetical protein
MWAKIWNVFGQLREQELASTIIVWALQETVAQVSNLVLITQGTQVRPDVGHFKSVQSSWTREQIMGHLPQK